MRPVRVIPSAELEAERRAARFSRIAWLAGAALLMLVVTVQPLRDTDVWWHLALGKLITAHGIPPQEPFSFLLAAHGWIGQQWLYEVLLAGLIGAGGPGAASVVMGVLACAALTIAVLAVPRNARVPGAWLAVAVVLSGLVFGQLVGVRGQVITLLGAAIVLFVLARWREGRVAAVWFLPPLFLLWANLHAGFIVGLLLAGAALVMATPVAPAVTLSRRPLALALGGAVLATLINPAGSWLYGYVAETFANPTLTQVVTEWMSPDFHNVWLRVFEGEAVLLVVLWVTGGGPDRFHALLAFAALIASLQSQRNVSLFAVVAAPQVALYGWRSWQAHVAPRLHRGPRRGPGPTRTTLTAAALVAVAAAAGATVLPTITPAAAASFEASRYPKTAVDYLLRNFEGQRVYTPDTWGGYLAYRVEGTQWGRVVFLYDETAIFGDAALQRYLDVHLLRPDWLTVLTQESIGVAIVGDMSQEASALHVARWRAACHDSASSSTVFWSPGVAPPSSGLPSAGGSTPAC